MPELTCEQVNERIAKACGWEIGDKSVWSPSGSLNARYRNTYDLLPEILPDYCHDLNACAEAERIIIADDPKMRAAYLRAIAATLGIETVSDVNSYRWALLTASPETRARALVQTLEETA